MDWQINKLSVDVNTDQTSMVLESMLYRNPSVTLNFSMPETMKSSNPARRRLWTT